LPAAVVLYKLVCKQVALYKHAVVLDKQLVLDKHAVLDRLLAGRRCKESGRPSAGNRSH
jgi:hypothetical protein